MLPNRMTVQNAIVFINQLLGELLASVKTSGSNITVKGHLGSLNFAKETLRYPCSGMLLKIACIPNYIAFLDLFR